MQLRTYLKLTGLNYPQLLELLKQVAEPGELDETLSTTTIGRHVNGENFPGAVLQDLYERATDRAVQPSDWVALQKEKRTVKEGEDA
jgi:hypothetical protein